MPMPNVWCIYLVEANAWSVLRCVLSQLMRMNPRATYLDALLHLIARLAEGPATASDLMEVVGRSRATLTREMRDAKNLGVVIEIRKHRFYELINAGIFDLDRLQTWSRINRAGGISDVKKSFATDG